MSVNGECEMINIGIMLAQSNPSLRTFDKLSEVTDYLNNTYGVKIERGMPHEHVYSIIKEATKDSL